MMMMLWKYIPTIVVVVVVIEPEKESGLQQVIGSYLLVSDSRELLWRQFYQGDPSGINCRIHHQSYSSALAQCTISLNSASVYYDYFIRRYLWEIWGVIKYLGSKKVT